MNTLFVLVLGLGMVLSAAGVLPGAALGAGGQEPPKSPALVRVILDAKCEGGGPDYVSALADQAVDDIFDGAGLRRVGPEAKEFGNTLRINIVVKPLSYKPRAEKTYIGAEIHGQIVLDGEVPYSDRFEARLAPDSGEAEEAYYAKIPEKAVFGRVLMSSDMVGALARLVSRTWKKDEVALLARVLADKNASLREGAAAALARLGQPAMQTLVSAASATPSLCEAAWGLSRMGEPGLRALLDLSKTEDVEVRMAVVDALGYTHSLSALGPIVQALKDKERRLRAEAARALGNLGRKEGAEALGAALQDESARVRQNAAKALADIGQPAVKELILALTNQDVWVRGCAAAALAKVKDPAAIPALIAAMKDPDSEVRWWSLHAVMDSGDPRCVDALVAMLGDEDPGSQWDACQGLVRVGPPAVPALLAALKQAKGWGRRSAIEAIGKIGDERALPALRAIVAEHPGDPDGFYAGLAIRSILSKKDPKSK